MKKNGIEYNPLIVLSAILLSSASILTGCKSTSTLRQSNTATANGKIAEVSEDTAKPTQRIVLPVFIPIAELQKQLYNLYFEPSYGKFYPCAGQSDCSDLYKDLYVENPILGVQGDFITINLHLAGTMNALIFHPSVSGNITITAKPRVSNDTLYFQNMTMENSSQNFIMSLASVLFEKQIITRILNKAWFSFRPALDGYTKDFQKRTPLRWGSTTLLLSLKRIYLQNVKVAGTPNEGILADFLAVLSTEQPTFGN